jgi:Protein of unknown function (DUF3592)
MRSPWALLLMAVLVGYLGWVMAGDLALARESRASAAWPTTSGEVTSSKVGHRYGSKYSPACSWPKICFRYALIGRSFDTCRPTFSQSCDRLAADQLVARYPVGRRVSVSYNPADPAAAVLEPNSWDDQLNVGAGIVVGCLVLALMGVTLLRDRRKNLP